MARLSAVPRTDDVPLPAKIASLHAQAERLTEQAASLRRQAHELAYELAVGDARRPEYAADGLKRYTARETAALLHTAERTVLHWLAEGRFPHAMRLGSRWRIPAPDIAAFEGGT